MKITAEQIEKAMKALTDNDIVIGGQYEKKFAGYISSFAASMAYSGLLASVIAYEDTGAKATDRHKTILALKQMLKELYGLKINGQLANYILHIKKSNDQDNKRFDDQAFIHQVEQAMTALKLALRMYKKIG